MPNSLAEPLTGVSNKVARCVGGGLVSCAPPNTALPDRFSSPPANGSVSVRWRERQGALASTAEDGSLPRPAILSLLSFGIRRASRDWPPGRLSPMAEEAGIAKFPKLPKADADGVEAEDPHKDEAVPRPETPVAVLFRTKPAKGCGELCPGGASRGLTSPSGSSNMASLASFFRSQNEPPSRVAEVGEVSPPPPEYGFVSVVSRRLVPGLEADEGEAREAP